jgi:hypothetical protein
VPYKLFTQCSIEHCFSSLSRIWNALIKSTNPSASVGQSTRYYKMLGPSIKITFPLFHYTSFIFPSHPVQCTDGFLLINVSEIEVISFIEKAKTSYYVCALEI